MSETFTSRQVIEISVGTWVYEQRMNVAGQVSEIRAGHFGEVLLTLNPNNNRANDYVLNLAESELALLH